MMEILKAKSWSVKKRIRTAESCQKVGEEGWLEGKCREGKKGSRKRRKESVPGPKSEKD